MSDPNTVRILALDGGGIRGLFSAQFLHKFCIEANIDPTRLFEHFDIIFGTSIGGVQAIAYCEGMTPAAMKSFFYTKGPLIFKDNGILPGYKARVIMGLSTDNTFYKQGPLKSAIEEVIGTKLMNDIGGNVVLTAWNMSDNTPVLFSNIGGHAPFLTGGNVKASDAALATAAAPLYFPKANINSKDYVDGGVIQNNPALIALLTAKRLFPTKTRVCLLSVGTCIAWPAEGSLLPEDTATGLSATDSALVPDNVRYMYYLLNDVFMGGVQKLNDKMLNFVAQSLYSKLFYLRFQYQFPKDENAPMDDASKAYLDKLVSLADSTYTKQQVAISNFIAHFKV